MQLIRLEGHHVQARRRGALQRYQGADVSDRNRGLYRHLDDFGSGLLAGGDQHVGHRVATGLAKGARAARGDLRQGGRKSFFGDTGVQWCGLQGRARDRQGGTGRLPISRNRDQSDDDHQGGEQADPKQGIEARESGTHGTP